MRLAAKPLHIGDLHLRMFASLAIRLSRLQGVGSGLRIDRSRRFRYEMLEADYGYPYGPPKSERRQLPAGHEKVEGFLGYAQPLCCLTSGQDLESLEH